MLICFLNHLDLPSISRGVRVSQGATRGEQSSPAARFQRLHVANTTPTAPLASFMLTPAYQTPLRTPSGP